MTTEQYGEAYLRNFEPMVRALMQQYGVRRETAEEVMESAWVHGFERLEQLKESRFVKAWVRQIAANKLWDDFRSRQRICQFEPDDNMAVLAEIDLAAIDATIDAERVLDLCDDERQRMMCSRVYIDECSIPQLAQQMGISPQALTSRLSRMRRLLRKKLAASEDLGVSFQASV